MQIKRARPATTLSTPVVITSDAVNTPPAAQAQETAPSRRALESLGREVSLVPAPVTPDRAGKTAGHSPRGALEKLDALTRAAVKSNTFAAVDMGSSSAKMLIARLGADGRMTTLVDMKIGTSLGKDLTEGGPLPEENQQRALAALKTFMAQAATHGVSADAVGLITTAAVRNASNGTAFMQRVTAETGISNTRVLTGPQEAELGFLGALAMFGGTEEGRFATLDLGGGSFQLAVGSATAMETGASTQIGSNQILDRMLPQGVVGAADFARLDAELKRVAPLPLDPVLLEGRTLVAVGGVSKFLRAHFGKDVITREDVDALRRQAGALRYDQRVALVVGTKDEATRVALGVDTPKGALDYGVKLPASSSLLLRIMDGIGVTSIKVSETDARHVLLAQLHAAA